MIKIVTTPISVINDINDLANLIFFQDLADPNPLIRSSSLGTLASIPGLDQFAIPAIRQGTTFNSLLPCEAVVLPLLLLRSVTKLI